MFKLLRVSCLLLAGSALAAPELPRDLELFVGEQKVLDVPQLGRLALGDAAVAEVKTIGNHQVLLVGSQPGETTLRIWRRDRAERTDIKIRVTAAAKRPPSDEVVPLKVGGERVLELRGVVRVAVGDADTADVKVAKDGTLTVTGVSEGDTTLLVWVGEARKSFLLRVTR